NNECKFSHVPPLCARNLVRCRIERELSGCMNLNVHSVVHFEEEVARVLEAPFNVWDGKFRSGLELTASGGLDGNGERQFMILAVEAKDTGDVNLRCTLRGDSALYEIRRESDFWKLGTIEDLLVHFLVAAVAFATAAGGVNDDFAAGFARRGIKTNLAALELEGAVNSVQC